MGITTSQLKALFGDLDISEDTITSIKLMVEESVQEKIDEAVQEIKEQAEAYSEYAQGEIQTLQEQAEAYSEYALEENAMLMEKANEYSQYVVSEMTEKIDAYSAYVVEKFIEDNKQTLVDSDEYARMKGTFETVKEAFENAFFQITPSDNTAKIEGELKEAKDNYNEIFSKYQEVVSENTEMQYAMIFESLTKDLADTQKEKLKSLVEHVSFDSVAEFKRGVELMIGRVEESSTPVDGVDDKSSTIAEEVVPVKEEKDTGSKMTRYLKVL